MEQMQNMTGDQSSYESQSEEEMYFRMKYLKQPNETKEQREIRQKNVRELLKADRESQIGVHSNSVLNAFKSGKEGK